MRWQFKLLVALVLGLFGLDFAISRAQFGGMGGLGGLMAGKDGRSDPLTLLHNASVKKELRLTDDQLNKVDAAIWDALAKALDHDQVKRLKQIDLQQRDYKAFGDVKVQEELKLSKQQKSDINNILAVSDKELTDLTKDIKTLVTGAGGFQGVMDKSNSIRKEAKERCAEVLQPDQRRMWQEMIGDDFKLEMPKGFDFQDFKIPAAKKGKKGG